MRLRAGGLGGREGWGDEIEGSLGRLEASGLPSRGPVSEWLSFHSSTLAQSNQGAREREMEREMES